MPSRSKCSANLWGVQTGQHTSKEQPDGKATPRERGHADRRPGFPPATSRGAHCRSQGPSIRGCPPPAPEAAALEPYLETSGFRPI
jgi:hypothetical protein